MISDSLSLKDKLFAKIDTEKEDPSDLLFSMKIASLLLKTNGFTNQSVDYFISFLACLDRNLKSFII